MPIEPKDEVRSDGLTKGQGYLMLFLLAANLFVQILGWKGVVADAGAIEQAGASQFGVIEQLIAIAAWAGIIAGGAILAALIFTTVYVWWNSVLLGRLSTHSL